DTSINPAIRISGFVIPSSFGIRHSSFLTAPAFYRNWFPGFINSNESKHAVCDAKLFAGHIARYPNLDRNGHGSPADSLHPRITSDRVPYAHRFEKRHSFHRRGNDTRLRSFRRKNAAAKIHLGRHPSAENVAVWICVLWHGNRLDHQLPSGLIGHLSEKIAQSAIS